MTEFNWVDYTILAIFIFSILGGFIRGGIKEIISLLTWFAAFIIAGLFANPLASYFSNSQAVQSAVSSASGALGATAANQVSLFSLGISFAVIFFAVILIGTMLGFLLNQAVVGSGVGIGNRLLGGIFGLGRGYLIVLVLIFLVQLSPLSKEQFWSQSSLVMSFQPAVEWFSNFVQPGIASLKSSMGQTMENLDSGAQNAMGVFQQNSR
ncbi:MAG: CvpA family protein [Gammaproteobacteria bacterium]